ncbi:MAG: hypothetical protein HRU76_13810 [Phycisphaeraceae bacterium]|nr:hypothetical protein [Phycisphaerales bacterium]QOJ18594.1 MAG: hypothetical protein HRU76_13810 [Phycisphaeraceae bacterium]
MARGNSIQVTLPVRVVRHIGQVMASGHYKSEAEVVRDALTNWAKGRERLNRLIDESRASFARGEGIPVEELMRRLEAKIKRAQNASRESSLRKPRRRC